MPRQARKKSTSGIYHIMMRGINRQKIFEDQYDYTKFLQTLKQYKEISGYQIYAYCLMGNRSELIDTNFVLKMFDKDRGKAVKSLIQFCMEVSDDNCLEMEDKRLLADPEAIDLIKHVCQVKNASDLQKLDKAMRNEYLKRFKEEHHLSIRQIERLTGINRGIIFNA